MMLEIVILLQIVTECLPISSSSHLRIVDLIAQKSDFIMPLLPAYFDHFLHGPMIVIILIFFARRGLFLNNDWILRQAQDDNRRSLTFQNKSLARGSLLSPQDKLFASASSESNREGHLHLLSCHPEPVEGSSPCIRPEHSLFRLSRVNAKHHIERLLKLLPFFFITTSITVLFWFIIKPLKTTSFFMSEWTLLLGLIITTMLLFSLRWCSMQFRQKMLPAWLNALVLGIVQGCALLPGISRFASTFVVARWLGYPTQSAFMTSFLMELPLIVAGFLWYGLRRLIASGQWHLLLTWSVAASFIFGTVLAYACLCWVASLAERNLFWKFGWYMFVPIGLLVGLMVW